MILLYQDITWKKTVMLINFESIKVWNKLLADIRTSDSLNDISYEEPLCIRHSLHVLTSSLMYFVLFLLYALSLCNITNNGTIFRIAQYYSYKYTLKVV